jgi:putative ABC transport system substrate-binding protein
LRAIEAAAPTFDVQIVAGSRYDVSTNAIERIERDINTFAQELNGGLIVLFGAAAVNNRDLILGLAARHRLPAMYASRAFMAGGGLMSYDTDFVNIFERAASYVDRILRGEKPGDLPVQAPTKFDLIFNLRAAKALGLTIPLPLLGLTQEVIDPVPRIHHASRRSGGVAAHGARSAAGNVGGRVAQRRGRHLPMSNSFSTACITVTVGFVIQ